MGASKAIDWDSNGWVGQQRMVFLCIPIRTAVFFFSAGSTLLALLLFQWRYAVEKDRRPFVGGYAEESRVMIDILELSALIWGALGCAGALYLKGSWLRVFYYYQALRLIAWFVTFAFDVPELLSCELGRDDPHGFVTRFGHNEAMLSLAAAGLCDDERSFFFTLSPLTLAFFLRGFFATQSLLAEIEEVPRYLLNVPKETASGSFYSKSSGTRSAAAERFAEAGLPVPAEIAGYPGYPQVATPLMAAPGAMQSFGGTGGPPMMLQNMASRTFM
eukprot:gb/GFBE01077945.1/.p1 GENE.gb/GFBE01077945.1/~~gb/GFBE01077945.1/.p1  ORF type:complete len:274 (+),score=55.16 gb/GFBE01077945.1/:1-822(+)